MTTTRLCVFCGAAADSREHVFAKRLCKRAGAVRFPVIAGIFTEGQGTLTRPKHHVENVQVRHVCTQCNNTWMNDLESWFEHRLGHLIESDWPRLAVPMIEVLATESERLAHWLLKTAVTFNLASIKGMMPVEFPPDTIQKLRNGILPDRCWVDLAYSKLPTIGGVIGKCFRVINGGMYNPCQVPSGGFRFTVQLNHLLLRVARAPDANVTYQSWQGELPVRVYPNSLAKIPDSFSYEDIMKFEHAVILETWLGCRGNIV